MTQLVPDAPAQAIPDLTAGLWPVDVDHSTVHFEVGHPRFAKIRGSVPVADGQIQVGASLEECSVHLALDPAGVYTGLGRRDDMLRGPNFFDVDTYPLWSFESQSIARKAHGLAIIGALTLHGVTKSQEFEVDFDGLDTAEDGLPMASFSADATIDRRDFALEWTAYQSLDHVRTAYKVKVRAYIVASPQV
jgi:polyisoprenoid-binding protein YceI